jgi:hypothetical protein
VNTATVVVNRPAVEAGLAMLDAGGDFVDGVEHMRGVGSGPSSSRHSTRRRRNC